MREPGRLTLVSVQFAISRGSPARILRCLPVVVGIQTIHGCVEAIVRSFVPVDGAAVGPVEEVSAIGGGSVTIAAGVGPVDG